MCYVINLCLEYLFSQLFCFRLKLYLLSWFIYNDEKHGLAKQFTCNLKAESESVKPVDIVNLKHFLGTAF